MFYIKFRKKVVILGSTGSVGRQTLDVVRRLDFEVLGLAAKTNIQLMKKQICEFKPKIVTIFDEEKFELLRKDPEIAKLKVKVLSGMAGLIELATCENADIIVNSLSGMIGLEPTFAAVKSGKTVAISNKEALVTGGKLLMEVAQKNGAKILPVDSEHSAIFQCLRGENKKAVKKIILTASGGPFFGKDLKFLKNVTLSDALRHPVWSMGKKNTVDSATLVNKGLELIEAMNLFGVSAENIEILIHREGIIHSMVEFCDGSVIAQMSAPDMRLPIEYALTYPERNIKITEALDFSKIRSLTFAKPDLETFSGLRIFIKAAKIGAHMPIVLNSANEELVNYFLDEKISFLDIAKFLETVYTFYVRHRFEVETLEEILDLDKSARVYTRSLLDQKSRI